ncbi:MAG: hypothetical protein K2Y23_02455 [Cyanobacteria bacterium]|nr:hypothetical protein [Cyanobacteriota bacterium]
MSATRARDRIGRIALYALIVTVVASYFAALYGPPPPNANAIAAAGHLSWLFVIWAYWVDRHRTVRLKPDPHKYVQEDPVRVRL